MLARRKSRYRIAAIVLPLILISEAFPQAEQTSSPRALSIQQAVDLALQNYPLIAVSREQMNFAAARIRLAQTAYLPRVDGLAQINRATRNNVFGLLLPQSIIPSISGPVLGSNNSGTVWDSVVGLLVTWQPFDFGLRRANVATANAAHEQAQAALTRTRFEISVAAADSFLTVIAAQQTAKAAQGAVDSWQTLFKTIHAAVAAQLRPGADESRIEAELAVAETQLAEAEQAIEVARANLGQFVGIGPSQLTLEPGKILDQLPADRPIQQLNQAANPLAAEQNAVIGSAQAELRALRQRDYPQFFLQSSAYARGSGAEINGDRLGGFNGIAPTTQNFAVGLTVVFPFMDRFSIRAEEAAQDAIIRSAQAQYRLIETRLQAQFNAALARLSGARRVAAGAKTQAISALTAMQQASARYRSGLSPIDEVAQAQRLLVQAQIDEALARLGVWRAALEVEAARGDIQPFMTESIK
jgi:outer membrane protein